VGHAGRAGPQGTSLPLPCCVRAKHADPRQLIDSNGMEVFSKYFRRLLQNNAPHIFSGAGRNADPHGNYQLLADEMQKLRTDPDQAQKIAESINTPEGDLFREFDLPTFIAHFHLDSFATAMLAAACKSGGSANMKAKGASR
jgi:CCR4-NOT transcription complex subunit 1